MITDYMYVYFVHLVQQTHVHSKKKTEEKTYIHALYSSDNR